MTVSSGLVFQEIGNKYYKSVYIHGPGNPVLGLWCMEQSLGEKKSVQVKMVICTTTYKIKKLEITQFDHCKKVKQMKYNSKSEV